MKQFEVVFSLLQLPWLLELLLWSLFFIKISVYSQKVSIFGCLVSEYDVIIDIRQVHEIFAQELTSCLVLIYSIVTSLIILGTEQVLNILANLVNQFAT